MNENPETTSAGEANQSVELTARSLGVDRGWEWIAGGWRFFTAAPVLWIVCVILLAVIYVVLLRMGIAGQFLARALLSLMVAGLFFACNELRAQRPLAISHLFAAFRDNAAPSVILGVLFSTACLLLGGLMKLMLIATIGSAAFAGLMTTEDPMVLVATVAAFGAGLLITVMVGLVLLVPIAMAMAFAPALVLLDKMAPLAALRASFDANLKNILPSALYGIVMLMLLVVGAIPAGLGLLVVGPLIVTSTYVAYREIFHGDK